MDGGCGCVVLNGLFVVVDGGCEMIDFYCEVLNFFNKKNYETTFTFNVACGDDDGAMGFVVAVI